MHLSQYRYSVKPGSFKTRFRIYKSPCSSEPLMSDLVLLGTGVVVTGLVVIALAVILGSRGRSREERGVEVKGGGVIMIGPIPIIFGSSPRWAVAAMLLAMALLILGFLLTRYS